MINTESLKMGLSQVFDRKKIIYCILFAIIPASIFYSLSLLGLKSGGYKIMEIIRDPAQQSGASSFLGFLSSIGIWLWVSSAAISFFFFLVSNQYAKNKFRELFFLTGMLSIFLAVDDFFMIHDRYVDQKICYITYAIFLASLGLRHFKMIISIEGFAFIVAGTFLALSILTDLRQEYIPMKYSYVQIFEEGFKFLGAATWLYFNSRVAFFLLNQERET